MNHQGITIKEKKKGNAIEILVDSEKYNEDLMFQNVTLETEYQNSIKKSFDNMFKGFTPEDLEDKFIIRKTA